MTHFVGAILWWALALFAFAAGVHLWVTTKPYKPLQICGLLTEWLLGLIGVLMGIAMWNRL